jgi:[acyl-carrier-protein] S-malonyltransferase
MAKTAVLFPGQGAQKVGMGADFAERHPAARALYKRANEVLGYDLAGLCFGGPESELTLTRHCQPAIYVTSAAIMAALEAEHVVKPGEIVATAGLSLGEYTALYYAGVFSFEDGLRLVAKRGAAMQEASDAPPSGMTSLIGADLAQAQAIAQAAAQGDVLCVANLLSPGQIVLSGTKTALERVPAAAKEHGVRRAIPLSVAGAFHSPLMEPAAARLRQELERVRFSPPRLSVYGNVTGKTMTTVDEIRESLAAQVVRPVQWQASMEALVASGVGAFIEPGPGKVLAGLLKKVAADAFTRGFDQEADLQAARAS